MTSTRQYESVFRPDLFQGQTVVITGGGSGIGRCTAHELARLGAHTVLIGRTRDKLDRVCSELHDDGHPASAVVCDIRDQSAVQQCVTEIVRERGRIHHLVNNAGGQFPAPLLSISQNGFETVMRTNLVGGFLFARECVKQSLAAHGGAIVNMIADMWRGMPGMGHTGAARAGMLNLTQTMAIEWAALGIRVNAVAPGYIASSGLDHYEPSMRELLRSLRAAVPMWRLGSESEVSAAVTFLLSPAAAFITGECLRVDGGAPLQSAIYPVPEHRRSPAFDGFHRGVAPAVLAEAPEPDQELP